MKSSYDFRKVAREQLVGRWAIAVGVCLIAWLLTQAFTSGDGTRSVIQYTWRNGNFIRIPTEHRDSFKNLASLISFIISGPINLGLATFFLKIARRREMLFEDMFSGFKDFANSFVLNLLIMIFTILWTLLFVIPGIIALFRYSMAYYIMHDNPGMDAMTAIRRSKEMMHGHKGRLFELCISFIGWFLLSCVTFGIGFVWLIPYYNTAKANFYEDLKCAPTH